MHDTIFHIGLFNAYQQEVDFVEVGGEDEIAGAVQSLLKVAPLRGGDTIRVEDRTVSNIFKGADLPAPGE